MRNFTETLIFFFSNASNTGPSWKNPVSASAFTEGSLLILNLFSYTLPPPHPTPTSRRRRRGGGIISTVYKAQSEKKLLEKKIWLPFLAKILGHCLNFCSFISILYLLSTLISQITECCSLNWIKSKCKVLNKFYASHS